MATDRPPDELDEALEAFDREILRNENGARDELIAAGVLVPVDSPYPVEILADLEHEQWIAWSKALAEVEDLSEGRLERWGGYWRPYAELDDETKEHDRVWARRAIARLQAAGFEIRQAPTGEDARYSGGRWHRRTVELLNLLVDATKVQREPCDHAGIGRPGCVTCDPRIRETLGTGYQAEEAPRG